MKSIFAPIFLSVWLTLLGVSVAAQERKYLSEDPKELAAQYLARIQQVAGMQPNFMPTTESRKQATEVAGEIAQIAASAQFGRDESVEKTRFFQTVSAELLEKYDELVEHMPTPYSHWLTLWLIKERSMDIEIAAADLGHKAAMPPILIGDVPTVCVNAFAVDVSGSRQRLVLVQGGMVNSAWHAMNLFVGSIGVDVKGSPNTSFETVRDRIRRRTIAPHFTNALGAAAGEIPNPVLQMTPHEVSLVGDLHRGATLFVLAHEYAHIILKHTESDTRSFALRMAPQKGASEGAVVNVVTSAKSREQEFAADKLGLELLVRAAKLDPYSSGRIPTIAWAPEVYFAWLELFDASVSQFTNQPVPDYSRSGHPSPAERLKELAAYRVKLGLDAPSVDGFRNAWRLRLNAMNNPMFKQIYGPFLKEYKLADCP